MTDLEKFIVVYYPNKWSLHQATEDDDLVGPLAAGQEDIPQMGYDDSHEEMGNEDILPSWAFYLDEGH